MNAEYIPNNYARGYVMSRHNSRRGVHVPLAFIDINDGNFYDAMVFAQIMYWHEPNTETGKPRLQRHKDGELWLAKNHSDWHKETRIKASTVRKCLERLKDRGLIIYTVHGEKGRATPFIRINWNVFEDKMKAWESEQISIEEKDDTPVTTGQGVCPTVTVPLLPEVISNTETTTETTTENKNKDSMPTGIEPQKDPPPSDPNEQPSAVTPPVEDKPKLDWDAFVKAVRDTFKIYGNEETHIVNMLLGRSKKKPYAECNFSPPATLDELHMFRKWYAEHPDAGDSPPRAVMKIQSWMYRFRESAAWKEEQEIKVRGWREHPGELIPDSERSTIPPDDVKERLTPELIKLLGLKGVIHAE